MPREKDNVEKLREIPDRAERFQSGYNNKPLTDKMGAMWEGAKGAFKEGAAGIKEGAGVIAERLQDTVRENTQYDNKKQRGNGRSY